MEERTIKTKVKKEGEDIRRLEKRSGREMEKGSRGREGKRKRVKRDRKDR